MATNVHIITPIITEGLRNLADVEPLEKFGIKISHSILETGPASIESEYDEALAVPDTIRRCIEAEAAGADAIVIDCMGDPGLKPCREVVSVPVLGPMQTSLHAAAMLGSKVSIVTVLDSVVPMLNNLAMVYGLADKLVSTRVIDLPVLEIEKDLITTQRRLGEASLAAVKEDGADAIIFGCTGFLGCADAIKEAMLAENIDVPVIDPIPLTVLQAAAIANAGYSHSKKTYAMPRDKEVIGYNIPVGSSSVAQAAE